MGWIILYVIGLAIFSTAEVSINDNDADWFSKALVVISWPVVLLLWATLKIWNGLSGRD